MRRTPRRSTCRRIWSGRRARQTGDPSPLTLPSFSPASGTCGGPASLDYGCNGSPLTPTRFKRVRFSCHKLRRNMSTRGVRFAATHPSVSASYLSLNQDPARAVAPRIPSQLTRTHPEEWVFDDRLFHDNSYHLNHSGRELRTQQLAHVLQSEDTARPCGHSEGLCFSRTVRRPASCRRAAARLRRTHRLRP